MSDISNHEPDCPYIVFGDLDAECACGAEDAPDEDEEAQQ